MAINPEIATEKIVKTKPSINSKANPAMNMLRIFVVSFWWLYWALYLITAVFTPQSRKVSYEVRGIYSDIVDAHVVSA